MCSRGVPPIRPRKYLEGDHYLNYKLTFDQVEEILESIEWIAEENEEHMKVLISAYYALRDQNGHTLYQKNGGTVNATDQPINRGASITH